MRKASPAVKKKKAASPKAKRAVAGGGLRDDVRTFKRERIIQAATDVFYRDGYQTATVGDVAASMSLTKAAVYYYFDSKEALLQAIIERCSELTIEAVERGLAAEGSPAEKLAVSCYWFAKMVLENQKLIALYFREERNFGNGLHKRVTTTERSVTTRLADVLEEGIQRGDFRACDAQLLALNITGMISMSFYWYTEHGHLPKEELCFRFAEDALQLAGYRRTLDLKKVLPAPDAQ